ncbi:hypothetical protein [Vineibacter terrae]|uniref:hypothetical protein n=1 Tax=Vineibacter terrae TaxID=2586908 RepID=UPI0015B42CB4|nr:hypothetical protein [Vineibacter terrae]
MKPVTAITVSILALVVTLALDRAGVLRQPAVPVAVTPTPAPAPSAAAAPAPSARGGTLAKGAIPRSLPPDAHHQDTIDSLPPGKGRDETFYLCAACHGTALIKQQGLSRELWEASFQLMIDRHGMAKPDDADRALIVDYLSENFPPRRKGRSGDNPFLK